MLMLLRLCCTVSPGLQLDELLELPGGLLVVPLGLLLAVLLPLLLLLRLAVYARPCPLGQLLTVVLMLPFCLLFLFLNFSF